MVRTFLVASGLAAMLLYGVLGNGAEEATAAGCATDDCSGDSIYNGFLPCSPDPCAAIEMQQILNAVGNANSACRPPENCYCIGREGSTTYTCTSDEEGGVCAVSASTSHTGTCYQQGIGGG